VIDHREINRFERTAMLERRTTMLRKFAGALLAATLLTAPAFAGDVSKSSTPATATTPAAPAAVATQPLKGDAKASTKTDVKVNTKADVKASATVKTIKGKHARKHFRSHIAKHSKGVKSVKADKSLKSVKHVKTSKRFHAKSGNLVATKSVTKTGTN
jgi:hypothetical protein